MWNEVKDLEEAKRIISNPTYEKTGEFLPEAGTIDQVDITGKVVLDFGCGVGRNVPAILNKKPSVLICYDYPNMIKMAKEQLVGYDLIYADYPIMNLLMKVDSVDVVFASLVFQHIAERELRKEVLPAIRGLIGDKGRLVVSSRGYTDEEKNVWDILLDYFTPLTPIDRTKGDNTHQIGVFKAL